MSILDLLSQDNAFVASQDGSSRSVFAMRLKAMTVYHAAISVNDSSRSTGRLLGLFYCFASQKHTN